MPSPNNGRTKMQSSTLNRTMKVGAIVLGLAGSAMAKNYYLDTTGLPGNLGTDTASPWKSVAQMRAKITLAKGDSILFKRGQTFKDSLFVTTSGVVVSSYGAASLPRPTISSPGRVIVVNKATDVTIQRLGLRDGRGGCIELWDSTVASIVVQDNEMWNCGGGVYATGSNIRIQRNYIHDSKMVVNTQGAKGTVAGDDDYGASGINIGRINFAMIYDNRLVNLRAKSFDYGFDGGAFEFWRSVRNVDIARNFANNADGFAEWGGVKGDSVVNLFIHHNIGINTRVFAVLHFFSGYGVAMKGVQLDNNLIVNKRSDRILYADGKLPTDPDWVMIRNNIFVSDTLDGYMLQASAPYLNIPITRKDNIIWSRTYKPDPTTLGKGEIYANPSFANAAWNSGTTLDTAISNYFLQSTSPAVASGHKLGYSSDFLNKSIRITSDSLADRGPFSFEPVTLKQVITAPKIVPATNTTTPNKLVLTNRGQLFQLELTQETPTIAAGTIYDLNGAVVGQLGTWVVPTGLSFKAFTLPRSGATRVLKITRTGSPDQILSIAPAL